MTPTRYRLSDLNVENEHVWWTIGTGEVRGFLKITRRGNRIYRVITGFKQTEDLPEHHAPMLWRPVNLATWPDVLPLRPAPRPNPPEFSTPVLSAPEPFAETGDGWPYPGMRLGRPDEKPETTEEAEARLLRMVRTHIFKERQKDDQLGFRSDCWPKDLRHGAIGVKEALRNSKTGRLSYLTVDDYSDFHVVHSDLDARPAQWIPTRRDLGDYERHRLTWWDQTTKLAKEIIRLRAANPPYSWKQIADRTPSIGSPEKIYDAAMKQVYRRSRA